MKLVSMLFLFCLALLAGCATDNGYVDAQKEASIAHSKTQSDIAAVRLKSIEAIAASNASDSAKAMGFMALMAQNQTTQAQPYLQPPQQSAALQWAQVLVPGLTQIAGIHANMQVATTQSNNAATVANGTNAAFVGIAGKIQAAPTVTTTTTTDRHDVVSPTPITVTPIVQITPTVIAPTVVTPIVTPVPVVTVP